MTPPPITDDKLTELRECPFCGCSDHDVFTNEVECMQCGARGPTQTGPEFATDRGDAIAAWNRRAPDARLSAYEEAWEWRPIETAPLSEQIIVWEPMYGWLLAMKDHHNTKWYLKTTGNFYAEMNESVATSLTHWAPISPPKPPAVQHFIRKGETE